MDYTQLTDAELAQVRQDATTESDRRLILSSTPATVAELAARYAAAGGDPADLVDALTAPDPDLTEGA